MDSTTEASAIAPPQEASPSEGPASPPEGPAVPAGAPAPTSATASKKKAGLKRRPQSSKATVNLKDPPPPPAPLVAPAPPALPPPPPQAPPRDPTPPPPEPEPVIRKGPLTVEQRMEDLLKLWRQVQAAVSSHKNKVETIQTQITTAENNLVNYGKICGEYQLIWKIKNFTASYEEALKGEREYILSPAFDTHRNGYRLQLSICPNGDGRGKGQALSVFFAILKGTYDSLLEWPYNCPVTITLFEQVANAAEKPPRDVTMIFTPNPLEENRPFLGKPTSHKNLSLGFAKFIRQKDLFEGEYIKDDTLFIKVKVDISNVAMV